MPDTAKNWPIEKAPKYTRLLGDKLRKPESVEHIIEFPGGAIEVARCTDGTYWAHIIVFGEECGPERGGKVVGSRITRTDGGEDGPVIPIEREAGVRQIAVLIAPCGNKGAANA